MANLEGADFSGAEFLEGTDLTLANIEDASMGDMAMEEIASTRNWEKASFQSDLTEDQKTKIQEMGVRPYRSEGIDIFFDRDSWGIKEDQVPILEIVVIYLNHNPSLRVRIEGHTAEKGTFGYNLTLGGKQAKAVKYFLQDLGIDGGRMETISYGEDRPFCEESSEDQVNGVIA